MTTQLSAVEGGSWASQLPIAVRVVLALIAAALLCWLLWRLRSGR